MDFRKFYKGAESENILSITFVLTQWVNGEKSFLEKFKGALVTQINDACCSPKNSKIEQTNLIWISLLYSPNCGLTRQELLNHMTFPLEEIFHKYSSPHYSYLYHIMARQEDNELTPSVYYETFKHIVRLIAVNDGIPTEVLTIDCGTEIDIIKEQERKKDRFFDYQASIDDYTLGLSFYNTSLENIAKFMESVEQFFIMETLKYIQESNLSQSDDRTYKIYIYIRNPKYYYIYNKVMNQIELGFIAFGHKYLPQNCLEIKVIVFRERPSLDDENDMTTFFENMKQSKNIPLAFYYLTNQN